jgi:hypothetical protein
MRVNGSPAYVEFPGVIDTGAMAWKEEMLPPLGSYRPPIHTIITMTRR